MAIAGRAASEAQRARQTVARFRSCRWYPQPPMLRWPI